MPQRKLRLLAVTVRPWAEIEPFLRAFEQAGFGVALVHGTAGAPFVHDASIALFPARAAQLEASIEQAMTALPPDLVVPADAVSFEHLRALHAASGETGRLRSAVTRIVARSLGDLDAHDRVAAPAALQSFARDLGLPAAAPPAAGIAAARSVACLDGAVLAGVSVKFSPEGGGVKIVRQPRLDEIATAAIGALRLSGIASCEFGLEPETKQPRLVAVKPYAEPRLPLARAGEIGLPDALYAAFAGDAARGSAWRAAS